MGKGRKIKTHIHIFYRRGFGICGKVKTTLERQGYVTFIFLQDVKQGPLVSPQEAGRFFREAGHHFVIDTPNARKSVGVQFERSLYGTIVPKRSGRGSIGGGQPGPTKPKGGPTVTKSTPPGGSGGGGRANLKQLQRPIRNAKFAEHAQSVTVT